MDEEEIGDNGWDCSVASRGGEARDDTSRKKRVEAGCLVAPYVGDRQEWKRDQVDRTLANTSHLTRVSTNFELWVEAGYQRDPE